MIPGSRRPKEFPVCEKGRGGKLAVERDRWYVKAINFPSKLAAIRVVAHSVAMLYRHRVSHPPLDAYVESIWLFQTDPRPLALERILPTGAAQLIVNLQEDQTRSYDPDAPNRCVTTAGTVLSGVSSRFQIIDTSY